MSKVLGALVGVIAAALYALAAAEVLKAETGVDLLATARTVLPADILTWVDRLPLRDPEAAPAWRIVVVSIALGAGMLGSLLLVVGARLSATLLWLAFLLLLGVLGGFDFVLGNRITTAGMAERIALVAALAPPFLIAMIAHIATTPHPEEPEVVADTGLKERVEHVRELLRSEPAPPPPSATAQPAVPVQAPAVPPAVAASKIQPAHAEYPPPKSPAAPPRPAVSTPAAYPPASTAPEPRLAPQPAAEPWPSERPAPEPRPAVRPSPELRPAARAAELEPRPAPRSALERDPRPAPQPQPDPWPTASRLAPERDPRPARRAYEPDVKPIVRAVDPDVRPSSRTADPDGRAVRRLADPAPDPSPPAVQKPQPQRPGWDDLEAEFARDNELKIKDKQPS